MGKNLKQNSKAVAANERKAEEKAAKGAKAARDAEDTYWKEASKGEKSGKKDKKKEDGALSAAEKAHDPRPWSSLTVTVQKVILVEP